jgi:membrane-associated protease RseP (regulator of RpoE activity)
MTPFTETLVRHLETAITLPLCLLTVLVVHELGHYLAARVLKLKVESVTFGRGRLLWSRTDSNGTIWRLHLWPLRAHVHITDFENPSLSFRKKLFVILAGPAANFILPFILFFGFFASVGQPAIPTIVTGVEITMPAYKAGLRPGDRVLSIDGEEVRSMEDISARTHPRPLRPLLVRYERGGKVLETSVLPEWAQYRDLDGVKRAHGRIGLTTWQQAYKLEAVRSVAGVKVDDEDAARTAILAHMDAQIELGLHSMDDKTHVSLVNIPARSNRNLADPDHAEHDKLYIGTLRDNLYLPLTLGESVRLTAARAGEMLYNVALLPFNLFPIDKKWITPEAIVSGETSYTRARLYVFVFFASLCSCFIGFLNLLPFPNLDGGKALLLAAERFKRRPLARREQAALIVFSLLFFYAAIFGANMDAMRGYYLFQMQKAAAAED